MNVRPPILSLGTWSTNGEMFADIADRPELGYLPIDGEILDPTYGLGTFWSVIRPEGLVATDLDPAKSPDTPAGLGMDATCLPPGWSDRFDITVVDPDYKLNGKDQGEGHRYGVAGAYKPAGTRIDDGAAMLREAARVTKPGGFVLFKWQDQTNGGRKRWGSRLYPELAEQLGLEHHDQFLFPSYRAQPARSRCLICDVKIERRRTGAWADKVRTKGHDSFACAGQLYTGHRGHAPNPDAPVQALSHINYSVLLVFRRPDVGETAHVTRLGAQPADVATALRLLIEVSSDRSSGEQDALLRLARSLPAGDEREAILDWLAVTRETINDSATDCTVPITAVAV